VFFRMVSSQLADQVKCHAQDGAISVA
jgi:hypothetical protein